MFPNLNRKSFTNHIYNDEDLRVPILKLTAIYGAKGANGVIMVTTKKGVKGDVKVNFNTYYGTQKASHWMFCRMRGFIVDRVVFLLRRLFLWPASEE